MAHGSRLLVCLLITAASLSGVAAADPAPIVYAGQAATSAAPDALAGGGDNSYGYGAQARRRQQGAPIDLRRTASQPRTQPVSAPAPAANFAQAEPQQPQQSQQQGAERPGWLEQERVGAPYQANGRWYVPTPEPGYEQTGMASWYGPSFNGQRTASGEAFDQEALTAAHPTLPIPSLVQVTNLENGREIIVRVNDRGPFVGDRLIDLSRRSAEVLGFEQQGQARVHVRYLGPAPRHVGAEGASPAAAPVESAANQDGPVSLLPQQSQAEPAYAPPPAPSYSPPQVSQVSYNPPVSGGVFVQVGAFSDVSNAQRVRDAVSSAGPVAVDVRQTARGELFRVRVGPFNTVAEAEQARQTLGDLGYGESIIASR